MKSVNLLASVSMMFLLAAAAVTANAYGSSHDEWVDTFNLEECDFSSTGGNDYFVLNPGQQLVLEGEEDGAEIELVITALDETKTVDGVETRIVEERESEDGEIIEISRNYFAECTQTGDVFYFGEDVDNYEDGVLINHDGAWLAGVDGARAGLFVPAEPEVGFKHYQEVAPGVAEDRAEVISIDETLETPAGTFENVLKTEETTPLEPDAREFKLYAPGIGLIQDADLLLASYTLAPEDEEEEQEEDGAPTRPMERRKEIVAREHGRDIHQRHMNANPASVGDYSPGQEYTLEASGESQDAEQVSVTIDASVWKSNGAIVIMDIIGGTVTAADGEYEVMVGYALYSLNHDVFRAAALVVSEDGDVSVLKLRGTAAPGTGLEPSGASVELAFKGDGRHMNSLNGRELTLEGSLAQS
jgi:hypothetical protein